MSIPDKGWLTTFPGTKLARLTNATENDVQDYDKACVRCFEYFYMEIISLEQRALYKSTGSQVSESREKSQRKGLFLQHQNACELLGFCPSNTPQNKLTVSKMASATVPSRSKRSDI